MIIKESIILMNENIGNLKREKIYKKEQNGNSGVKVIIYEIYRSLSGLRAKRRWQRKKSVNVKLDQYKWSNLKIEENGLVKNVWEAEGPVGQ